MKYENVILSGSLQVSGSLVLPSGPTNPSTGNSGDLFFNTTSGKAFGYRDEDGWNDLEAQTRNWNAHLWLSGDSIVEQAVHPLGLNYAASTC